jgi:hypothetical protein
MLAFGISAEAQERTMRLENMDVSITLSTQKIAPHSSVTNRLINNLYTQMYVGGAGDRTIPRLIADPESGMYFGYDLEVGFDLTTQKISLSIRPLSIKPIMEKPLRELALGVPPTFPGLVLVDDGDTIILNILEDARTKVKIVDTIAVRVLARHPVKPETSKNGLPDGARTTEDFAPEALRTMKLTDVNILLNDIKVANVGGLSGPVMYFYIPEKGRFIFSLMEHKQYGFQRIGVLEGNEISFTANGDAYKLISRSPILAATGRWNLWVLHDREFRPDPKFAEYSPYWMGVAERVEDLLKK